MPVTDDKKRIDVYESTLHEINSKLVPFVREIENRQSLNRADCIQAAVEHYLATAGNGVVRLCEAS